MSLDTDTIKLSPKDRAMIDYFAKDKDKIKSKEEFVSYAVKKTIYEMMLEEFHEKSGIEGKEFPSEEEIQRLHTEIKEIRRRLWKEYAENLP
jgi:hypothetical protein